MALRSSAASFPVGAYERLELAAQAAGFLAQSPKDPTVGEALQVALQVALHDDVAPEIPPEAIVVHTRRGQLEGRTMAERFETGAIVSPEAPGRDRRWRERLEGHHGSGA